MVILVRPSPKTLKVMKILLRSRYAFRRAWSRATFAKFKIGRSCGESTDRTSDGVLAIQYSPCLKNRAFQHLYLPLETFPAERFTTQRPASIRFRKQVTAYTQHLRKDWLGYGGETESTFWEEV